MMKRVLLLSAATAMLIGTASAQQQPHNPAVRDACAADIKAHCADAKPGMPTMQCVMQNRDKMSDGCKQAMAASRGQGMGQGMGGGNAAMGENNAGGKEKKPKP